MTRCGGIGRRAAPARLRFIVGGLLVLAASSRGPTARATYSIVATDAATLQVGGAGTSCVGAASVRVIYGVAPGHGAVHAQALVSTAGRNRAVQLLSQDVDPIDIIAAITAPAFDPSAGLRQ